MPCFHQLRRPAVSSSDRNWIKWGNKNRNLDGIDRPLRPPHSTERAQGKYFQAITRVASGVHCSGAAGNARNND
jgi:hypothetical protein